jgi:hypothetical protein
LAYRIGERTDPGGVALEIIHEPLISNR